MTLDAWNEYIVWSRELIKKVQAERPLERLKVLKCDADNETYSDDLDIRPLPILPAISEICDVSCIEIDQSIVDKALVAFPGIDIRQGDICNLPYEQETFDIVLDLSTIDHVEHYTAALDEYKRVLKPGGAALIVAWVDTNWHKQEYPVQFWFQEDDFFGAVSSRFDVTEAVSFDDVNDTLYPGRLVKFIARKPD